MPQNSLNKRRYSLRTSLLLLVLVCVLPVAGVSTNLLYENYLLKRAQIEHNTELIAQKSLADLEREFSAIEAGMKVLATSPALAAGDLNTFHQRARAALSSGVVYNYILTDQSGRQLANTLVPFGVALPATGTPPQLARVFTDHVTVLTDLFTGPVTQKFAIAMGVPVVTRNEVIYSLNIGLAPAELNRIFAQQTLPDGWLMAIIDSSGTIVARSRDTDRFIGQKAVPAVLEALAKSQEGQLRTTTKDGIPVFTAHITSQRWGWSIVVGAPVQKLEESLQTHLLRVVLGTTAALGLGLWVALTIARRVLSSVHGLNKAALDLGEGKPVALPDIQLREAEAVGIAILQAARSMATEKYTAQHDPLTGLANRTLFNTEARRQLALATRQSDSMAIIALDLDGFKQVNDTHGHAAGDKVLIEVARRLGATLRTSDIAARLGGDEFMVLLCAANAATAKQTANRMIARLAQPYADMPCTVSASAGIAVYSQHGVTIDELMAAADQALYAAKAAGKNRTHVA
jgi:diguanylate cyclase (GGDEF)-like protein